MRRWLLGLTILVGVVFLGTRPEAQAVVQAQILDFWRVLRVGGMYSNTLLSYSTLGVDSNGYVNFGAIRGSSGFGIRDNGGIIEAKNQSGAWAAVSGGANPLGTFLVQTATAAPANAQVMGLLGTGVVLNTTTTGVQSIYSGTSCTNQFIRSLSATAVANCNSVSLTNDASGTLQAAQFPALTGDVTTTAGSLSTTLANSGVTAASYGSATAIPTFTVDAKGRLTAATTVVPQLTLTSTFFSSLSGANLTGLPTSALTGTLAAGQFPALTGDVTTVAGALATTVAKIGGNTVTIGGAFTTSGAFTTTLTVTGNTSVTLPTSGTLVNTAVTALSSLVTVGTIGTGVWQGTAVTPAFGGTGLSTITAHAAMIGEGTSSVTPVAGGTNCVLYWTSSGADPTCSVSPVLTSPGFATSSVLGGTGVAGAATTQTSLTKVVTGIADATATTVLTITVPNAAHAATVHLRIAGSLGAGGAVGAFECSASLDGSITVARTAGLSTVATAATADLTSNSCVAGATTITLAYAVGAVTGAAGATQTVAIIATITKGGGGSAAHQAVLEADVLNAQASGVTIS